MIGNLLGKIYCRIFKQLEISGLNFIALGKEFKPDKQILVFSDPRGGSSWMAELLKAIPDTAIIWEPLNTQEVREFRKLGFSSRQHIPEFAQWPEAKRAMAKMLSGRIINEWTSSHTYFQEYFEAKRLIIKICRGNRLIPWLTEQFDFDLKPVYLVRHPFAVVLSQLQHGGWNYSFSGINVTDTKGYSLYEPHQKLFDSITTIEEERMISWCLSNKYLLEHERNDMDWITVYYEDLLTDPAGQLNRIFDRWQIPIPDAIMEKVRRASSTTRDGSSLHDTKSQLTKWKKRLSKEQIKSMSQILEYFNIKNYSSDNIMPIKNS